MQLNDNFQRDYKELVDLEKNLQNQLTQRKGMGKGDTSSVMLEHKIYKDLDIFSNKVSDVLRGYSEKYKTLNNSKEANDRINKLNDLKKSHKIMKEAYEKMLDDKYEYVSNAYI